MIFLKNMDRMGFIMKNKECMNCGSTQFHQVKNGWKCEYCGTIYLNTKKRAPSIKLMSCLQLKRKKLDTCQCGNSDYYYAGRTIELFSV